MKEDNNNTGMLAIAIILIGIATIIGSLKRHSEIKRIDSRIDSLKTEINIHKWE